MDLICSMKGGAVVGIASSVLKMVTGSTGNTSFALRGMSGFGFKGLLMKAG